MLAAGALAASFLLPLAAVEDGPVLCPFRRMTSLPCPACGLTRSFVATAHGRLPEAFAFHLFGPFLFLGFFVLVLVALSGRLRPDWWRPLYGPLLTTWLLWAFARWL